MGMIVAEETYEVTVQRVERYDGETVTQHCVDGGPVQFGRPRIRSQPERQPLFELAWKGRLNAIEEL